jgi:membrane protein DedA with SNARE-associated domain
MFVSTCRGCFSRRNAPSRGVVSKDDVVSVLSDAILTLPSWVALVLIFALPALEASAFVGFVFPGEIAVILGGVLASEHELSLAAVLILASTGAVIGDSIGYAIGTRYGRALLNRLPKRVVKPEHVDRGVDIMRRLGGRAVFVGRFTAALRVLVPGLCGIAGMPYRTFLTWNVIGGVTWACGSVMLGYLAGTGYKRVEHEISLGGYAILSVIVVVVLGLWLRHRRRTRREASAFDRSCH